MRNDESKGAAGARGSDAPQRDLNESRNAAGERGADSIGGGVGGEGIPNIDPTRPMTATGGQDDLSGDMNGLTRDGTTTGGI